MINDTLGSIILRGMNNPDCSFFVGQSVGMSNVSKYVLYFVVLYFCVRALDNFAYEPLVNYIKKKFKNRRKRT